MSATELGVDSATGVAVSLPVAGPGVRLLAFVIDWHIRLILAVAWYVAAALLYNRRLSLAPPPHPDFPWFAFVLAPAALLYFLYHVVLETGTRGRTPGKRMAGVEIADRLGGSPSSGALVVRNVFRLIDCLPAFYVVGLMATMLTRGHARIGDLAAGTRLVYTRAALTPPDSRLASAGSTADPELVEIAGSLLDRWERLQPAARADLAHALLARAGNSDVPDDELRTGVATLAGRA